MSCLMGETIHRGNIDHEQRGRSMYMYALTCRHDSTWKAEDQLLHTCGCSDLARGPKRIRGLDWMKRFVQFVQQGLHHTHLYG
eukprot:1155803-Pelagomonas_calceolata.AAC.7